MNRSQDFMEWVSKIKSSSSSPQPTQNKIITIDWEHLTVVDKATNDFLAVYIPIYDGSLLSPYSIMFTKGRYSEGMTMPYLIEGYLVESDTNKVKWALTARAIPPDVADFSSYLRLSLERDLKTVPEWIGREINATSLSSDRAAVGVGLQLGTQIVIWRDIRVFDSVAGQLASVPIRNEQLHDVGSVTFRPKKDWIETCWKGDKIGGHLSKDMSKYLFNIIGFDPTGVFHSQPEFIADAEDKTNGKVISDVSGIGGKVEAAFKVFDLRQTVPKPSKGTGMSTWEAIIEITSFAGTNIHSRRVQAKTEASARKKFDAMFYNMTWKYVEEPKQI